MPVEIKELIVRTTIDRQNNTKSNAISSSDNSCQPAENERTQTQLDDILKLIKTQNER